MEILTDKETRLFKQLTVSQQKVYLCLRSKRFKYKKETFYGRQDDMAKYLNMSIITVKRAVKKLQEIGLLTVEKRWKINYYSLPCYDNLENKVVKETKATETPVVQETPKQEDFNIEDLEVSDNPDTDFSDLLFKVKMDGVIDSQICALRGIPECTRWQEQQRVVNMVASHFGVRNNDAQKVVEQIVCGAF